MSEPVFQFGEFELHCGRFQLLRKGRPLRAEPKPLELLILLVSRKGNLVTRREIVEKLWESDVFVDTDHSINTAIRKLRHLLRDDSGTPKYIETVTGMGYRFIAPINQVEHGTGAPADDPLASGATSPPVSGDSFDPLSPATTGTSNGAPVQVSTSESLPSRGAKSDLSDRHRKLKKTSAVTAVALLLLVLAWIFRPVYPKPRITGAIQLTSDGTWKFGPLATDGQRVYFTETVNGRQTIVTVPISGGQAVPVKMPFAQATLYSISSDKNDLLVAEVTGILQEAPLWRLPIVGGTPRRLGNITAHDANWSPDGTKIAYVNGSGLYLANADGSDPRVLVAPTGVPNEWAWRPTWSSDGSRILFCYYDMRLHGSRLWELNADGSNLHPLFADLADAPMQAYGNWTPDGRYFIYTAWNELESSIPWPASNLWTIREKSDLFHRRSTQPSNLTTGPIRYLATALSPDGRTIFALSSLKRGELMRYNTRTKMMSIYAAGLSAEGVRFSQDGSWVAYVTYPRGELWRSRADGSEPLQLSSRPLFADQPMWSPDNKQIAFVGGGAGEPRHIFLVPADGGRPRQLSEIGSATYPSWSPDGKSLIFADGADSTSIRVLNLQTGSVEPIPGSLSLNSPRISPDGRWIAAVSNDWNELLVFDTHTRVWKELGKSPSVGWLQWSGNSKYLYFAPFESHLEVFRIRLEGGKLEQVVTMKDYRTAGFGPGWFSLTPDGDLLALHDTGGGTEIYALSWDAP